MKKTITTKAGRPKKKYDVSLEAWKQRKSAAVKPGACHDWVTIKCERALVTWAKEVFGSPNKALQQLKNMEG